MIISHQYKFIFLKTRKTAGTSVEIALSKFCGEKDVITPMKKKDEELRKEMGFRGPQNYNLPLNTYSTFDWISSIRQLNFRKFFHHADAQLVKDRIGDEIWNNYFKFTIERNPFDKAISRYFWSTREPRPDIESYLNSAPADLISNWNIYSLNDRIEMDQVVRYEFLAQDLSDITEKIGLPEALVLPNAKGSHRKSREHYSKILSPEARKRIEIVCAKEIKTFGYVWSEETE